MKRWRYRFSRMLNREQDGAAIATVQDYLDRFRAEQERHQREMQDLEELHADIIKAMTRQYKVPRELTMIVDPGHLAEHGVIFLMSKETEDFEDGQPERTTEH